MFTPRLRLPPTLMSTATANPLREKATSSLWQRGGTPSARPSGSAYNSLTAKIVIMSREETTGREEDVDAKPLNIEHGYRVM